jgi:hypothetical protein
VIKARGTAGDGKPVVILGLSGENVARLFAAEPIRLNLADLGLPACHVIIMAGKTEEAIAEQLRRGGLLTPGAGT